MNRVTRIVALAAVALAFLGCESRTDKTDGGGVLLSVSDFDGLPLIVDASQAWSVGLASIESVTIQSIVKDPFGSGSDLMNVELRSYEVRFSRADSGTRTPPSLVNSVFGTVPVGGTAELDNVPFLRIDQLNNLPLSDLLDFGYDRETGSAVIRLTVSLRFFGNTLSGDPVETAPAYFTIDVVP